MYEKLPQELKKQGAFCLWRYEQRMGEIPILSGMLFCADCGAKLYQVRARGWTHEQEHFVCATYRKIKGGCATAIGNWRRPMPESRNSM